MKRRRALTALTGTLVAAAGTARPLRAADPVKIATIPLDAGAEAYYALDMGFFRDAGLDADVQGISNGSAIASAVASDAVDIGFANLLSIAVAYKHQIPFTLLAPGSLYLAAIPTSVCMVPKNSPLKTAKDLDGKTFGANGLKTITQFAPQYWMDKNGGDSTSVKFVEMSFPQILSALGSERIDAAVVAEPFIAQAKDVARIISDCYDALGTRYIIGCWFTTTAWAKAHPDLAAKFAQAMARTADWANKNKAQSGTILTKYGKLDPQVAKTMLRVDYAPRFDVAEMQPVIDLGARYGAYDATFPASELIFKP
jgi:NitT/TauT family transport system substrate-binding protein